MLACLYNCIYNKTFSRTDWKGRTGTPRWQLPVLQDNSICRKRRKCIPWSMLYISVKILSLLKQWQVFLLETTSVSRVKSDRSHSLALKSTSMVWLCPHYQLTAFKKGWPHPDHLSVGNSFWPVLTPMLCLRVIRENFASHGSKTRQGQWQQLHRMGDPFPSSPSPKYH